MRIILGIIFCLVLTANALEENSLLPFLQSRIISGAPATPGQFPWQVILKKDETDSLLCGASIISNAWVLTAAHCTYGLDSIYLLFGTVLLNDENALSMTSTELYIHPKYNNQNLNNDVSLISLPTSLTFTTNIQPIRLVSSQDDRNFQGTIATIAGFGLTDDEYLDYSETLLYAQVVIIDNQKCVSVFGSSVVISSTLCARAFSGDMSICTGDSGGPLITRDTNSHFIQIGINSFVAEDRCTEGYPSGYVRLSSFLDFIYQITGIESS